MEEAQLVKHRRLALALAALLLASPAAAEIVEVWTETGLRLTSSLGGVAAADTATGLATVHATSAASSRLATLTLPSLSLLATLPVTDPAAAPVTSLIVSLRARPDLQGGGVLGSFPGAVLGTGSLSPRTIPITGNALVCVLIGPLPPCGGQFDISFGATQAGQRIGGGVGGVFTFGDAGTAIISVHGAPWTVATVTVPSGAPGGPVGTIHSHGFAHGPVSLTGSTLLPGGVLQIVTPTRATGIDPPSIGANGAISRILVHVVPEPGRLLLLVSGAALVAWLGWRRRP